MSQQNPRPYVQQQQGRGGGPPRHSPQQGPARPPPPGPPSQQMPMPYRQPPMFYPMQPPVPMMRGGAPGQMGGEPFFMPGMRPSFQQGQFAPMGGGGRGSPQYGYAPRIPGGQGMQMYAPGPMYSNPGAQVAKGQQGGPRPMGTGMRGSPPLQPYTPTYMTSVPPATAPVKPKSRAIAIVDPNTNEEVVIGPLPESSSTPAAAAAAPAPATATSSAAPTQQPSGKTASQAADSQPPSSASVTTVAQSGAPSEQAPPQDKLADSAAQNDEPTPATPGAATSEAAAETNAHAPDSAATGTPPVPSITPDPAPTSASAPASAPEAAPTEKAADDSGDDWESKDESQLLIEPGVPDKPKSLAPPVSLRPGGGMAFASSTKVSAASANGKKVYDRDFLMQFQATCNKRPEGLPDMEILVIGPGGEERPAGKGKGGGGGQSGGTGGADEWRARANSRNAAGGSKGSAGAFADNPRSSGNTFGKGGNDRGRGGDRRDQGRGGKGQNRNQPFVEVKPLSVTDNRWKPTDHSKVDELERLLRTTKGLLNKFTPEKMSKLTEQFLELEIKSRTDMVAVIDLVFDKALFEPIFGYMYAELCAKCAVQFPEFPDEKDPDAKPHTFKRLLLNKCQEEFEKENHVSEALAELPEDATEEDRELLRKKTKSRMLGNIRFIGELYKQKMLTERIMHECLCKLCGEVNNPDEDVIECLCKLLTTIGKIIDHPKCKGHMDEYFSRMQEMFQNHNLPNRMRFMLQEVIELRRGQWVQRKPAATPQDDSSKAKGGRPSGDARKEMGSRGSKGAAPPPRGSGRGAHDDGFTAVKGGKGTKGEPNKGGEASAAAPAASPPAKKLSKDELAKKIDGNLDEYFSGAGVDELVECTRDLQTQSETPDEVGVQVVEAAMSKGFDARSNEQRDKCAMVIGALYRAKLIKSEQVATIFNNSLEYIEDELCDVPHIATYMAQFIAAAIHDEALKLSFINEAFKHLIDSELISASQMACAVLTALHPLVDDDRLRRMYAEHVHLDQCLPAGANGSAEVAQLLESKGLSFVDPQLGAALAKVREAEQLQALEAYLETALGDADGADGKSDQEILAWIAEHSSSSTATASMVARRVLETVPVTLTHEEPKSAANKLCKSIERRQTLLKQSNHSSNIDEQLKRQANCLFEVQRYCARASWPAGLAKMLFYKLYEKDIVFEDAFNIWREDTSDSPEKLKALVQVNEFLQWLATAQEDGEGEEDQE